MSAYTPDDVLPAPQRRIRHIASLQVRNLTPFPARDALAQTLSQPRPNSSSLSHQPADDIELTLGSRRRRRVSSSSISTVLNAEADDEAGPSTPGTRRQRRTSAKASLSFQSPRSAISGSGTSTIRQRARTGSKPSAVHTSSGYSFTESERISTPSDWDGMPAGAQFITHSQRALEKIVSSRLVQTFITLTQPPSTPPSASSNSRPNSPSLSSSTTASGVARRGKDVSVKRATSASVPNHLRGTSTSSTTSTYSAASPSQSKRAHSLTSPSPNLLSSRHKSGASGRLSASSKLANFPSPPPTPPPRSPPSHSPTPSTSDIRPSTLSKRSENGRVERPPLSTPAPFYISPLHLPSTNPFFSHLDPEREFAPWADLSGSHLVVSIWGEDYQCERGSHERDDGKKGKGKASAHVAGGPRTSKDRPIWKTLEEWVVDLDQMELLSPDIVSHHLPSNTLLLTVSSGETFRIPSVSSIVPSRDPSPLRPEYNSDGEVDGIRRLRREQNSENQRRERETLEKSRRETRMKRSAGWQDLVKVVNLQACIIDTKDSLEEIVRNCNLLVEGDGFNAALREASEREERFRSLCSEREQVLRDSARVKDAVEAQRKVLKLRRETLTTARAIHKEDLRDYVVQSQNVDSERQRHATLLTSLLPLRTTLLQTVSFIFPIEPLSAPDLLFAILGAPLPIPVSASDPAPPLSLASQPEVTEDNTATALGYVAQVVQLISAYQGKSLVYPVTCCGSRSVIKDPISAMMGPRMFPLYSKGVETYRFEYGVFLLNKDIEMLMMDRDLRAMDMRHTLPNLKNLLLTLTTGEGVEQKPTGSSISVAMPSNLQHPTRAISPLALEASQSKQYEEMHPKPVGAIASRKSAPLLSPLAAILRARYPSSAGRPTVKVVDEMPEPMVDGDTSIEATPGLRNIFDDTPLPDGEESKVTIKSNNGALPSVMTRDNSFEKLAKGDGLSTPHTPLANAT